MSKHFMILIVFSVIAIGAVLAVLMVSSREAPTQTATVTTTTKSDAITSGDSNQNIETDINNTKVDDSDSDLTPTEKSIKSL